jgi:hypothetical protein
MKKVILSIAIIATVVSSYGQVTITETKDEMTDKVSYSVDGLVCANAEQTVGFGIHPNITVKNNSKKVENLIVQMAGLGNCNEKNVMIILFDNGDKMTLNSWNKFTCKGSAYFSLTDSQIKKLSTIEISKIRLTNGESYKSHTSEIDNKKYFIELFEALK